MREWRERVDTRRTGLVPDRTVGAEALLLAQLRYFAQIVRRGLIDCPPTLTVPEVASYRRGISCTSVVFAAPVPPIMPTVAPAGMCSVTCERASLAAAALYLKLTSAKSMLPSATAATGSAGVASAGSRLAYDGSGGGNT